MQSAQALVSQAQQANNTATQATLSTQFDALLVQIGKLANDLGFNGVNLLGGNTLTVTPNRIGQLDRLGDWRQRHQRQRDAAEHRQFGQQLGAPRTSLRHQPP